MNLFDRPLFVGAHADDIELFAGGTLAKYKTNASCMVFSFHEGITNHVEARRECEESLTMCVHRNSITVPETPFRACDGAFQSRRAEIYRMLAECWPSVVVTHPREDTNQDHQQVVAEVLRVFKKRCSILCGEFQDNMMTLPRTMFVELGLGHVSLKAKMLETYKSQEVNGRSYLRSMTHHVHAASCGAMVGMEYAEAFEVVRLFG